ncbi:MAG: cell division protein FtsQ/DivIB [Candidatus Latescibacterota bacterium]|jgi:cell division protein FtsQ
MKAKKTLRKKEEKKRPMVVAAGNKGQRKSISLGRFVYVLPLLLLLGTAFGAVKLRDYLVFSERFDLVALEVDGLRLLNGDDVLQASGISVGDNVLEIDIQEVSRRLEQVPWIKRAIVMRKPPDRLVVEIVERQRLAWVELGQTYGIDREGVLLPGWRLANESYGDVDLPVILGVPATVDSLYPGLALADTVRVLREIITWWKLALEADPEFCTGISEIVVLSDEGIGLRMAGDGLEVRLPLNQVETRLRDLKRMMPRVYREYPNPAYIDLRYAGQLIVGSKETGSG